MHVVPTSPGDRLAELLRAWRGSVVAPQENRGFAWPDLRGLPAVAASPDSFSYVATALDGVGAGAAATLLLLWSRGYAPAPLDVRLDATTLAIHLGLVRPSLILCEARHRRRVADAVRLAGLAQVEIRQVEDGGPQRGLDLAPRLVVGGDPGLVVFTSGTTGTPKAVLLTRDNLVAVAAAVAAAQRLGATDRVLNALSLAHVNAPVVALLATACAGGDVVLLRRFEPADFWRMVAEHDVTWANLAPPLIATLVRHAAAAAGHDRTRLRFVRSASAPLASTMMRAFEEAFGVAVVESYGITEAASQVTINNVPPGERRPGWVGWPRDVELRLVDDEGRAVRDGTPGEVFVRGPGVMQGYVANPEATALALRDGWLATGDIGIRDETGALRLVGRRIEMINRGGEKVAPRAVEEALLGHPAVIDAAVVGVPDDVYGQEIAALVVPRPGMALTPAEVSAFARRVLPVHMRPRRIVIVAELPRTATGKIARRALATCGAR